MNYQNVAYLGDSSCICGRLRLHIWTICVSPLYDCHRRVKNQNSISGSEWHAMACNGMKKHAVVHHYMKYQPRSIMPFRTYTFLNIISELSEGYISGRFILHIWTSGVTYLDDLLDDISGWLAARWHQAITWNNVDFPSVPRRSSEIHLRSILQEISSYWIFHFIKWASQNGFCHSYLDSYLFFDSLRPSGAYMRQ